MKTSITLSSLFLAAATLAGCAVFSPGPRASAKLSPTTGSAVTGSLQFVQKEGKVLVNGEVRGLKPNAEHGFHIHEKGDCSSGDGMSAGGHFNPTAMPHAAHSAAMHHAGDLPSLKADANGVATVNFESTSISVGASVTDISGKGLIVHRDPDDYKTQPTGNAGPRLACAVIVKS
ncbi:superoxide dismutase family protein [uncultured Ramlibacter sp.]|uniref:superoxide dismutase family protein n=1 Tax=uncultured Ramlibacter sp. TaxID=260755 RepID=UPI002623ECA1|nr:superoxide dismutase family protein [uncultured Ramlibacter sp.]